MEIGRGSDRHSHLSLDSPADVTPNLVPKRNEYRLQLKHLCLDAPVLRESETKNVLSS